MEGIEYKKSYDCKISPARIHYLHNLDLASANIRLGRDKKKKKEKKKEVRIESLNTDVSSLTNVNTDGQL